MFAFFVDTGYSNYTVEGTLFHCGVRKNPHGVFDRWYGEDRRLNYAAQCDNYIKGKPVMMDVEQENLRNNKMTVAQRIMWDQVVGPYSGPVVSEIPRWAKGRGHE